MKFLEYEILKRLKDLEAGGGGGGVSFNDAEGDPASVGTTADGTSTYAARRDHVHAHGNQTGGTLHSAATTSTAGFLAALDKATLTSLGIYAVNGGGVTSDITAAFPAAAAAGLRHVHLGDGTWVVDHGALDDDSALITIPDGFTLSGNGRNRTIISCTNTTTGANDGCATFRTALNACNVEVFGLHFIGENTGPYTSSTFNQNVALDVHWAGTSTDINFHDLHFESLWGFAIHDRQGTTNARISVRNCTGIELGNSLANVNCNFAHMSGNTVVDGEGFECSGQGIIITDNVLTDCTGVGITIGGNQTPGAEYPGNVIANNTIDGSTGVGITVTDGANATMVANNTIRRCDDGGILISHSVNPVKGCIIIGNVLESNCADPGANLVGMDVRSGSRHLIFGNIAVDLGVAGYSQKYGLTLAASDCVVYGNYFDAVNHDASYGTGATNTREAGNVYVNNTMEIISTATMTAQSLTAKAAADLVWTTRWNSGSGLAARSYHAVAGDGTHYWGDNSNLHDTNLYRSAADTLKTDDAFTALGNLIIGASKLTVTAASGNTAIAGTLGVTGDISVNTNKFTVAASTGNTVVAGTLAVTGAASASNLSGTNTGDQTSVSGNAGTATTLQTARNINGVPFNGSAAIEIGWSMGRKPTSAHADDEEFEGTAFTGWTQGGSVQATAIDPYANFNTATQWRHSWNSMRPSWLMIQPTADAAVIHIIHKAITVASSEFVWARLSTNVRNAGTPANNDSSIGIRLSASSGGAPDANNCVTMWLVETDNTAADYALQFDKVVAGVGTLTEVSLSFTDVNGFAYVGIQRISNDYYFWASSGASWIYLGTHNAAITPDRVSLVASNASTSAPGNMIMGCDFIRFVASATYLP